MAKMVLIVDDEPDVATYLAAILQTHGYTPVIATDVDGGADLACQLRPDLISLDIMMPRESGISMYVRVRRDPILRHIPVVIVSGLGDKGDFDFRSYVPDSSIPPPDHFLEKPIDVEEYLRVVGSLVAGEHSRDKGRTKHA